MKLRGGRSPRWFTMDAPPLPPLSDEHLARWEADGFITLRQVFSEDELARISAPIASHYQRRDFEASVSRVPRDPPQTTSCLGEDLGAGNFPLGFGRVLAGAPELAQLTCGHHTLLPAVEQLLGAGATVSQFIHTLRTPGSTGTGTHFDYKPWRPVGSFLDWCFAVMALPCAVCMTSRDRAAQPGCNGQSVDAKDALEGEAVARYGPPLNASRRALNFGRLQFPGNQVTQALCLFAEEAVKAGVRHHISMSALIDLATSPVYLTPIVGKSSDSPRPADRED
jgi:hypothetical protein